jgi:signal peptidase I
MNVEAYIHQANDYRAAPSRASKLRRLIARLARYVRDLLAFFGLLCLIYYAGFDLTKVISGSMAPTLCGDGGPESDWVLCERVSYWFREPRRWEVVQYVTDDRMLVAKRIVGLPGESIGLDEGRPMIANRRILPPESLSYLDYKPQGNLVGGRKQPCGDRYFFLGDDSEDSWDSRFDGAIKRSSMEARAWLIVWPPSRIGFVNDGSS